MPDMSAYATQLRSGGSAAPLWLSVLSGNLVLTAAITADPVSPVYDLAISITSGSISDVQRGFRVVVKTSGGDWVGETQVAAGGTLSTSNLPIREAAGTIDIRSGHVITVYDDTPPGDKLPTATTDLDPDRLAAGTLNSAPPPNPCSGGDWVGWLRSGAADVPCVGSASYGFTGGSLTHLWTASGASFQVGNSASANPTLRYTSAGRKLITHTVTDASNSASRVQRIHARVHDDADPPFEIEWGSMTADPLSGWSMRVRVFGTADRDTLPDGAKVAVWTEGQDYGADVPSRSHILLIGYVNRDEELIAPNGGWMEFDIISPMMRLAALPGFSKHMAREGGVNAWATLPGLTVQRAIVQIFAFYTWIVEAGYDIVFPGFDDAAYVALVVQKLTPLEQLRDLAKARAARVVWKKTGRAEVQGLLAVIDPADRGAVTTTYTITPDDIVAGEDGSEGLTISRDHLRPLESYKLRGATAGTTASAVQPVYAKYPASPGHGAVNETEERYILDDKAQGYAWCAAVGAARNGIYHDPSTGAAVVAAAARGALIGFYWTLFDFHREFLAIDDYTALSIRGADLDAVRWIFEKATVEWKNGVLRILPELRGETWADASAAVDDTPVQVDDNPYVPDVITPPDYWRPPTLVVPVPPGGTTPIPIRRGTLKFGMVTDEAFLVMTNSADVREVDGGAYWETSALSGIASAQAALQKVASYSTLFVVEDGHIYRVTGVGTGSVTVSERLEYASAPSGVRRRIKRTKADPDWLMTTSYHPDDGVTCAYSTDGGATWDESTVSPYSDGVPNPGGEVYLNFETTGSLVPGGASSIAANGSGLLSMISSYTVAGSPWGGNGIGGSTSWGGGYGTHATYGVIPGSAVLIDFGAEVDVFNASFGFLFSSNDDGPGYANISYFDGSKSLLRRANYGSYAETGTWRIIADATEVIGCRYVVFECIVVAYSGATTYVDDVRINSAGGGGAPAAHHPVLEMSQRAAFPGVAYTIAFNVDGNPRAYKTTDYGATWTDLSASSDFDVLARLGSHLERPLNNSSRFYMTKAESTSPYAYRLIRAVGTIQTDISPTYSGTKYAPSGSGCKEMAIADIDEGKMVVIGRTGGASASTGIWTTLNGHTAAPTWTNRYAPSSANAKFTIAEIGDDGAAVWLVGEDTFIYSADFLASQDDRSGNLAALAAGVPLCVFRWG